jgi:hypothetical protein
MEECQGDLHQIVGFDRYKEIVTARLHKTDPASRPPKPKKRKPRTLRSTEYKLISSRPSEVIPDDYEGQVWPLNDAPDPVVGSKANLARAEATFTDRPEPVEFLGPDFTGLGLEVYDSGASRNIPDGVMTKAIINDSRVGIDLLALGKPYGDIFNPDHWMYDETRDYFMSLPVFGEGGAFLTGAGGSV